MPPNIFVCYIPGLDRRLIGDDTPRIRTILERWPPVTIRTLPTTELVPTMITGVWPHEHNVWQVSLDEQPDTIASRLIELVPDPMITTLQCLRHFLDVQYDLAAIPYRRRRHFRQHRFKFKRRFEGNLKLGGGRDVPTIFDVIGSAAEYHFGGGFGALEELTARFPRPEARFDFLEFYGYDLFSHWNSDRPDRMREALLRVDGAVGAFEDRCAREGVTMALLVDHGQEPVTETLDLQGMLRGTGVRADEFHYYVEVGVARVWFRTERARREIEPLLRGHGKLAVYSWKEMAEFDLAFEDNRFGDLYLIAAHGTAFFPHDFYQPVASRFLGLKQEKARLRSPVHRANHGHHPDHPSEHGFLSILSDDAKPLEKEIKLIDVAPSFLSLLEHPIPPHMKGRRAFQQTPL